jgi:hypothetical protein
MECINFFYFSRKSDMDTATDHEQGKGFELRLVSLLLLSFFSVADP